MSSRETRILRLLSNGESYAQIGKTMEITPANVHATCWLIRQKTGIAHTRDPEECRAALRRLHTPGASTPAPAADHRDPKLSRPTPRQMEVLRLVAQGHAYPEIAETLRVCIQSVQNYASLGAKRAGLDVPEWKRIAAIKEWMAQREPETFGAMADPMF